jgi:hypothetical protein
MSELSLMERLTSEADRLDPPYLHEFNEKGQRLGHHSHAHLLRSAATALSLAQTEIKGHMRVEDDLQRDLANYRARESDLDLGVLQRALDKAQARIAELEKALKFYVRYAGEYSDIARTALKDRA